MYTLHWNQGSASLVAHMALEEAGVPYKLKLVDMDKGEHKTLDYLKINPNGKVPALALDGGGVMFETNAIAMISATAIRSRGWPRPSPIRRARSTRNGCST
ncbi:MAG TPA: glutathione S-transferase N-terminal domain-containing protein [Dongiaceae bacterium]